ncbi:uncharacterized protein TNCV_1354281 [Trichonephila clavipes]|nr:uncharacterized protein TNCV_1354281 [Trichonephila clavipes]
MDVCKCMLPLRRGGTLNSRRAASPLVWLVEGIERYPRNNVCCLCEAFEPSGGTNVVREINLIERFLLCDIEISPELSAFIKNAKISALFLKTATRGLLATDHVILNHGQVTWTTPKLAPPLLTTTPHQREDVSALDRFNMHRCPTRRIFSGTGLEPVTKQATVRYLYHSATAATFYRWKVLHVNLKRISFLPIKSSNNEKKRTTFKKAEPRVPWSDRGSLVVKVTNSCPTCHELEPGTDEGPPCRGGQCTLNISRLKRSTVGGVWK